MEIALSGRRVDLAGGKPAHGKEINLHSQFICGPFDPRPFDNAKDDLRAAQTNFKGPREPVERVDVACALGLCRTISCHNSSRNVCMVEAKSFYFVEM
ncbi:hypothetical protein EAG_00957 [Camponotus floridanus]|uniref:Uncharacterized protein n=1 Tax=Camponotus floridanus TaxID=104421 RepID=E2A316_CAMFO|nr:hypothetical protein EAG_00957 [Camponotus floridanus]